MNILIKLSGEFFTAQDDLTFQGYSFLDQLVQNKYTSGYIVIGGGNRVRGYKSNYERNTADQLGVLSTIMNSLVLKENLEKIGMKSVIYSHFNDFGKKYDSFEAINDFKKDNWVILASGLGRVGYVSTDLSAVIKSLELKVDSMIKLTKVDGVYDDDPVKNSSANLIHSMTYDQIINNRLSVIDLSAIAIAAENKLSIGVCSVNNFNDFLSGKNCGTLIR